MFKNKERRDTALLIFMAVIVLLFMAYLFIPFGGENGNGNGTPPDGQKENKQTDGKKIEGKPPPRNGENGGETVFSDFNRQIEAELRLLHDSMVRSASPFETYTITGLKSIIRDFIETNSTAPEGQGKRELAAVLTKLGKVSFFDLKENRFLDFPPPFEKPMQFNLLLAEQLVKIIEEDVLRKVTELSNAELNDLMDFKMYRLIDNEIQEDFQSLPVLFYFKLLIMRLNVYPLKDEAFFFRENLEEITDLSPWKYLVRIKEFLHFSKEVEPFRVEWREGDGLDADDKGTYANLGIEKVNFLKQQYLVFPHPENIRVNLWIEELCAADSGDIELIGLDIVNEHPDKQLKIKKILYSLHSSFFIVLLREFKPAEGEGEGVDFLNGILGNRIKQCQKNFTILCFPDVGTGAESFKNELLKFGLYLKKIG